jgi:L-asparaginase
LTALSRVAVVFTGGTISTVFDPVAGGNVPVLDGAAILARTSGLDAIAEVVAIDRGRLAASHLTFPQLIELGALLRDALADPAIDGAVLVQGTDTIDETSFCWDLLLQGPKPVVVTGAMLSSDMDGFDGPDNLRGAVRAAASPELRGAGVVVSLAGSIEAAVPEPKPRVAGARPGHRHRAPGPTWSAAPRRDRPRRSCLPDHRDRGRGRGAL